MARPECFEFAMDFLGEPEALIIEAYIEDLERTIGLLQKQINELIADLPF